MKKTQLLLMIVVTCLTSLCLTACSNEEDKEELTSNEVKVSFAYSLDDSSGNVMTRGTSTNKEIFDEFYEKIKTGELVAPTYELTLTEVNSGKTYAVNGQWKTTIVSLQPGTYKVVGTATAEGRNIQEKCSLEFNEQIEVSLTSGVVTLNANYDCALLIFNNSDILSLQNYNGSSLAYFFTFSTYKYAFINDLLYEEGKKDEAYIAGTYTNGVDFKVYTGKLNLEKGKYYVYNNMAEITFGYDVPPMEDGTANREIEGFGRVADAVDLGLSVKWASWNVGASQIADYGGLYGAGDPTGLLTSSNYQDYNYDIINSSICGTEYDIATVKWGGNWRLPTIEELRELKEECTWQYNVTIDGVKGSIATGPNGNELFFPYAGCRIENGTNPYKDSHTSIWSGEQGYAGSVFYQYSYKDMDIHFANSNSVRLDGGQCYNGQSVRPVCN